MLTGTKYGRTPLPHDVDVVVIGSGAGGLATAGLLARYGKRVLVLESHYTAGGMTHSYMRKGYEWDVGVHYIGGVHMANNPLRGFFDYLSDGALEWASMGSPYDRLVFPDRTYELAPGAEAFRETLLTAFPDERRSLDQYFELINACCVSSDLLFAEKLRPLDPSRIGEFNDRIARFTALASRTAGDVLASLSSNPRYRGVLAAQWGNYGLPPAQSSFAMLAMCAKHYMDGAAYPVGGSISIPATFTRAIEARGGAVITSARVSRIIVEGNSVRGVELYDGTRITAPTVVSATGVRTTLAELLPLEACTAGPGETPNRSVAQSDLMQTIDEIAPSLAHVCLYAGFEAAPADLEMPQANTWILPSYDHDRNAHAYFNRTTDTPPFLFVSFPATKDPAWTARYPGRATAEVMTLAPYEWFSSWESRPWSKRGAEYEDLKARFADQLLEALYVAAPNLRGKVHYHELSTPLSTRHFTRHQRGEIYGLEHSPARFTNYHLRPHTPLSGLFLSGQDISTNGVGGALYGGILAASSILGRDCAYEILSGDAPR